MGESGAQGVFEGSRFLHPELGFTIRFPENWETHNGARAVGAVSPHREAQVFLEHGGSGTDPSVAAAVYLEKNASLGLRPESSAPVKLTGRPAHRIVGSTSAAGGHLRVMVTFVAWRGSIYRITGMSPSLSASRYRGTFLNVARSFRPMTRELLESIQEQRLRVVQTRSGETLGALSLRTGNQWNLQQTAVMNGLFTNQALGDQGLVKISVGERYRPASLGEAP